MLLIWVMSWPIQLFNSIKSKPFTFFSCFQCTNHLTLCEQKKLFVSMSCETLLSVVWRQPHTLLNTQRCCLADLAHFSLIFKIILTIDYFFRYFIPLKIMFCFILPTLVPVYCWGESWYLAFMSQAILRYLFSLNFTWLVNSAAHMWGYRSYDR